jgi:hypothetical protein
VLNEDGVSRQLAAYTFPAGVLDIPTVCNQTVEPVAKGQRRFDYKVTEVMK